MGSSGRAGGSGHDEPEGHSQDVVLELATMLLAKQYSYFVEQFHRHLIDMHDYFFTVESQKRSFFELSLTLLHPVGAELPALEAEAAQQRLKRLLKNFEETCNEEIDLFRNDGNAIRRELEKVCASAAAQWRTAERRRQDEFMEMCVAFQRDLSAIHTEVKAEAAAFMQESRTIEALERALEATKEELAKVSRQLLQATEGRANDFVKFQKALQEDREEFRKRLLAIGGESVRSAKLLTTTCDEERMRHFNDLEILRSEHSALVEQLAREREEAATVQAGLREEVQSALRQKKEALQAADDEQFEFQKQIDELRIEAEEWRRRYQQRDTQAKMEKIQFEAMFESQQMSEVQEFKRQLAGAVRRATASISGPPEFASSQLEATTTPPLLTYAGKVAGASGSDAKRHSLDSGMLLGGQQDWYGTAPTRGSRGLVSNSVAPAEGTPLAVLPRPTYPSSGPLNSRPLTVDSGVGGMALRTNRTKDPRGATHSVGSASTTTDGNPLHGIALRQPSDSYLKLLNLSRQLKSSIPQSSGSATDVF